MSRSRDEEQAPYTPPLPASRRIEDDAYQEMAGRVWSLGCQLQHQADLLTAYGWQGAGAMVRSCAREAQIQARAMGGNSNGKLPRHWDVEQRYWQSRTLDRLRITW